ncbi:MAG: Type 1 glutamine amidotransferase-like domain-containing protein [Lachnospiraceae bacterium]|nr:Type 1 glutamine amidotransferase-like domain-containing protein [Lachnospiraceae bacterium]
MKRILLTSAGLTETMKKVFFDEIRKPVNEIKIIFVPSAATTKDDSAREGISVCVYELLCMGIKEENIFLYNLENLLSHGYKRTYSEKVKDLPKPYRLLDENELLEFDAIIFGGGDAGILLKEMNRTGFDNVVSASVERGLFYIGVSAGSMIAAGNFATGLRFIPNEIVVHSIEGSNCAILQDDRKIELNNNQAIYIYDKISKVIGG